MVRHTSRDHPGKVGGHSSISIALDIYIHAATGLQEVAPARFDEVFITQYNGLEKMAAENNY